MVLYKVAVHVPEINGVVKVFQIEVRVRQYRAVDAAVDVGADYELAVAVAVVRAGRAILVITAPELGNHDDGDVIPDAHRQHVVHEGPDCSVKLLQQAVVTHLEKTHNLTEHAGAASLAGALKIKGRLRGKKVALVMSGGNISIEHLRTALNSK